MLCLQLYTSFRDGKHSENSVLDDYAFYISALIELYNSTLDNNYLKNAESFCNEAIKKFQDNENGGFNLCEIGNNEFFMNPKEFYDGAIPSGNSVMAYNFVRLYLLTNNNKYKEFAEKQISYISAQINDYPAGYCMLLLAKLLYENPPQHITVILKNPEDLNEIKEKLPFLANVTVIQESSEYPLKDNKTTYYVCKEHHCLPPVNKL